MEAKQTDPPTGHLNLPGEAFFPVAAAESLPPGQGRTVHLRGREFALFNIAGTFHAIDNECPHRGAPLGAGTLEQGRLRCPLHGWAFDPTTGRCETRLGCDLTHYPTRVVDGEVQLCPHAQKTPPL